MLLPDRTTLAKVIRFQRNRLSHKLLGWYPLDGQTPRERQLRMFLRNSTVLFASFKHLNLPPSAAAFYAHRPSGYRKPSTQTPPELQRCKIPLT